jgi:hypothetical protein
MPKEPKPCYYCGLPSGSIEHIIPDSLGGSKLTSRDLLCQNCNHKLGAEIDKPISDAIGFLADLLLAKKSRNNPNKKLQGITSEGLELLQGAGGRPSYKIILPTPNNAFITLEELSEEEVIDKSNKKIEQLKHKNPSIKELIKGEIAWSTISNQQIYFGPILRNGKRYIPSDHVALYKGTAKIILEYCLYSQINLSELDYLTYYLKENKIICEFIKPFYPEIAPYNPSEEMEVSHILHLSGSNEEFTLVGYVELFNSFKYIMLLSRTYRGPTFNVSYGINIITGRQFKPQLNLLNTLGTEVARGIPYKRETPNCWMPRHRSFIKRLERIIELVAIRNQSVDSDS